LKRLNEQTLVDNAKTGGFVVYGSLELHDKSQTSVSGLQDSCLTCIRHGTGRIRLRGMRRGQHN